MRQRARTPTKCQSCNSGAADSFVSNLSRKDSAPLATASRGNLIANGRACPEITPCHGIFLIFSTGSIDLLVPPTFNNRAFMWWPEVLTMMGTNKLWSFAAALAYKATISTMGKHLLWSKALIAQGSTQMHRARPVNTSLFPPILACLNVGSLMPNDPVYQVNMI